MLTFSPRTLTKNLLADLPDRSRRIILDRYGLTAAGEERTLDAIGKDYGITRERVRQIENNSILAIRNSSAYEEHSKHFEELRRSIEERGAFIAQRHLLAELARSAADRKHLIFLLTVGDSFYDRPENVHFTARWYIDEQLAPAVEDALTALYESLELEKLVSEEELIDMFAKMLRERDIKNKQPDILMRWLLISKHLGKNPLGEWGRAESPHVNIRNTRDLAFLTLKRHGSPMHFIEVAKTIEKLFRRKAHPATTHNELIKDNRFVLVGRGLYALKEWGYEPGIVRDVIRSIIEREGPLSREDIIERVKRERYVKDATIAVNLQHPLFMRLPDGRFGLANRE